jgi:hypothetical protein
MISIAFVCRWRVPALPCAVSDSRSVATAGRLMAGLRSVTPDLRPVMFRR